MKHKTIGIITITLFLLLLSLTATTALDESKNTTIEMNGIKICVPQTEQGKITNASSPQGIWTYTYSDDANNITIYVCDEIMPEYALIKEEYNQYDGYTQQFQVKDKYVMVASTYAENKDFIIKHIKELNPE